MLVIKWMTVLLQFHCLITTFDVIQGLRTMAMTSFASINTVDVRSCVGDGTMTMRRPSYCRVASNSKPKPQAAAWLLAVDWA